MTMVVLLALYVIWFRARPAAAKAHAEPTLAHGLAAQPGAD